MVERIELENKTFTKDILDGTTFFQLAEGGAMGESGGIVFLTEEGKVYHANYCFGDLTKETMERAFPVLAECVFGLFGRESKTPAGWVYVYLGVGNHLIVRADYYVEFEPMTKQYKSLGDLYQHWLEKALTIKP
jgi:hypothetical protein